MVIEAEPMWRITLQVTQNLCHRYGFCRGVEFPTQTCTPEKPAANPWHSTVATMAVNWPNDLDLGAWYEAAVRIDQNRAMNEAFQNSVKHLTLINHFLANWKLQKIYQIFWMTRQTSKTHPKLVSHYFVNQNLGKTYQKFRKMKQGFWMSYPHLK